MRFVKPKVSICLSTVQRMEINRHAKSRNYARMWGKRIFVNYTLYENNRTRRRFTAIHHVHTMDRAPIHAHAFSRTIIARNFVAAALIVRIVSLVAIVVSAIPKNVRASLHYVNVIRIYARNAKPIKSLNQA